MSIIAAAATTTDQKGSNHSDTSSDEADRRRGTERPAAAVGRSYECTFCKRGFTNAQALGGHMNIHRKDKLKAKQKSNINIPQRQQQQGSSLPSSYLVQIPTDQQRFYPSPRAQHVGYLFYPSYHQQVVVDEGSKAESLGVHGDLMGANLTLRIGPQREEEDGGGESKKKEELMEENEEEEEVDLELRLGHHKYS